MYTLYHFSLCPFSRLIRVLLTEKQSSFILREEKPWEKNVAVIDPSADIPRLEVGSYILSSVYAICEYLEEAESPAVFLTTDKLMNAEIRRLFHWFCDRFYHEVTRYFVEEKIMSHYMNRGAPRTHFIKAARNNLTHHLDYMELLLHSRKRLAGNSLSLADLAAATQISVVDYLGDIDWAGHQLTKEWYAVIKSRPGFRALLSDRLAGFTPPPHYQNLDF